MIDRDGIAVLVNELDLRTGDLRHARADLVTDSSPVTGRFSARLSVLASQPHMAAAPRYVRTSLKAAMICLRSVSDFNGVVLRVLGLVWTPAP